MVDKSTLKVWKDTFVSFYSRNIHPKREVFLKLLDSFKAAIKNKMCFVRETYARLVTQGQYTTRDFVILFVFAIILGITVKAIAVHFITIGFEDYKLASQQPLYDLNATQKRLIEQGGTSVATDIAAGGTCSE